jgi:hypothetical protein
MAVQPRYRNFDVSLDWIESENTVVLTHDPGDGTPTIVHKAPYDRKEEHIKGLIRAPETEYQPERWQKEAGQVLANAFFPDEAGGLGEEFRKALKHKRVRLRLHYPKDRGKAERLLDIPWEYLYIAAPAGSELNVSGFLCRSEGFSLAHCLESHSVSPAVEKLPLEVAFLSAIEEAGGDHSTEEDTLREDFEEVKDELREERHRRIVYMERWQKETEGSDFTVAFRNYDVVQSLSHGTETAFEVEGEKITPEKLAEMIKRIPERRARAIVLCACKVALKPLGAAATLHRLGIPVVIGMARCITTQKARRFMEDFYARLAEDACSVEEALATGRWRLYEPEPGGDGVEEGEKKMSLDWGLPRLYLAGTSGNLILRKHLYEPINDLLCEFRRFIESKLKSAGATPVFKIQQDVQDWIKGNQEILYIRGASGSGKSTEVAKLLNDNDKLIYHICAELGQGDDITNHPLVFIRDSLFPQLERLYEKDRFHSWVRSGVYPVTANRIRNAMDYLVIEPLRKARKARGGKRPVIVIEGVDHAAESRPGDSILELLIEYRDPLTEVARLIVTADSDIRDVDNVILKDLEPDHVISIEPAGGAQQLRLLADQFREYFDSDFVDALPASLPRLTGQLQQAVPHQIQKFAQQIVYPHDEQKTLDILTEMNEAMVEGDQPDPSANLRNYYQAYLKVVLARNKDRAELIEALFKALAVAYRPLPIGMVARLINPPPDQPVDDLVKEVSGFVKSSLGGLICEHPSIKRFLASRFPADEAHGLFVDMYRREGGGSEEGEAIWDSITDWSRLPNADYAQRYLVAHAYERYRKTEWQDPERSKQAGDFLALVTAPGFRAFRLDKEGLGASLEDIRRALQVTLVETVLPGNVQSRQVLDTIEHLLAAYNSDDNPAMLSLERRLRRENGGVPALQEFLGLFVGLAGWSKSIQ